MCAAGVLDSHSVMQGKRKSDGGSMRGLKQAERNKGKKTKPSYSHPLVAKWPSVGEQEAQMVMKRLREHFRGLEREAKPRLKYDMFKAKADEDEEMKVDKRPGNARFRAKMLAIGVNAVTKALEKGKN